MTRNSILGNGLEEKTQEKALWKEKVTERLSNNPKEEKRNLTFIRQLLHVGHCARYFHMIVY